MNATAVRRIFFVVLLAFIGTPKMLSSQGPVAKAKKTGHALERAAVKRQTDRATERFDPSSRSTRSATGVGTVGAGSQGMSRVTAPPHGQ